MAHDRNLGVTEARLGLTLLTCLLFVLGYVILHHLGGSGAALTSDFRPRGATESIVAPDDAPAPSEEQPQVLTIEGSDTPEAALHTSRRTDGPASDDADSTQR